MAEVPRLDRAAAGGDDAEGHDDVDAELRTGRDLEAAEEVEWIEGKEEVGGSVVCARGVAEGAGGREGGVASGGVVDVVDGGGGVAPKHEVEDEGYVDGHLGGVSCGLAKPR